MLDMDENKNGHPHPDTGPDTNSDHVVPGQDDNAKKQIPASAVEPVGAAQSGGATDKGAEDDEKSPADAAKDGAGDTADTEENDAQRLKKRHRLERTKNILWWAGLIIQFPVFLDLFGINGTDLFIYFPVKMSTTDPRSPGYFSEWYPRILIAEALGILCWIAVGLLRHVRNTYQTDATTDRPSRQM